jgi:hypothetical protein
MAAGLDVSGFEDAVDEEEVSICMGIYIDIHSIFFDMYGIYIDIHSIFFDMYGIYIDMYGIHVDICGRGEVDMYGR